MDWGRAKTILILSFLFLNLILGYQLWTARWGQLGSESDTAFIIEETNKLLASKQIQLRVEEVPKDAPKLKSFTVQFDEASRNTEIEPLDRPIKLSSPFTKSFFRELTNRSSVRHADQYTYDPMRSRDGIYVFNQMVDKVPLFDVTLQLYEENGQITGYKQAYVEVQSGGEQQEQKVISAYTAIRSLAENYLAEGTVIVDVKLGYHGPSFDSETQYMLPFWRIMLEDGNPYYVQAYNGEVEEAKDKK
ncbi:two-component system regulatory protein YycI [Paenibacillus sp. J2TS4]|uniref:two-component system regulatory protein YycI n=1 Tax=Paenibacillus sp. J2TS4 TaxID=2807194 RepID=UPI001B212A40|nr:two-component system regulatory protein YycI [Paenibacillus sp. J2TS4]GIP35991.1 hypothetical protein J2TS4_52010 [Paenibacillus sp. J2TS4]